MKTLKSIFIITLLAGILFSACDVDYFDNPNAPTVPPTSAILNSALYQQVYDTRDEWFAGRFTTVTMQYFQQSEYGDEDRYGYRESIRQTWTDLYLNCENLRKVIEFNTGEETKTAAAAYGANENQIALARVMLAWSFNIMTDTWGDIPYYSYGSDNPDFQALKLSGVDPEDEILEPAYAAQEDIYADILNELDEAEAQFDPTKPAMDGDNIYNGDIEKWRKFANSLRLRIALKIRGVNQSLADQHIADAQTGVGVFTSNDDNAIFTFEANDKSGAPFYRAYNVDNRSDFAAGLSFVELLKGNNLTDHDGNDITTNPFAGISDPRLPIFVQPNSDGNYVGMFIAENSSEAAVLKKESLPGDMLINKPDYGEPLMEYAEVAFILSELNGWDQTEYENGVRASMQRWGVAQADIDAYVAALPAAGEETVLTQKYIALYMQPHTAWAEYRRTGYPETLIMPNDDYTLFVPNYSDKGTDTTYNYTFTPIPDVTDLPYRMRYPQYERTLNGENRSAAVAKLNNGDAVVSKLWWDVVD